LLSRAEGFLHGSLVEMARRCGNPRCRCASDDASKHRSLYLGQTRDGRTTMLYVPADLEPTVRRWAQDYRQAAALLEDLCAQGRERIGDAKAKARTDKQDRASKAVAAAKKSAPKPAAARPSGRARSKTTGHPPPKPS
jgi:hypothetical protein